MTVGREAPVHDGRLLHSPRVDPAGPADLLGNLDTLLGTLQSGDKLGIPILVTRLGRSTTEIEMMVVLIPLSPPVTLTFTMFP